MIENSIITLDKLLIEYNKYVISRLIDKEYNFNVLRDMTRKFSSNSDLIKYNEQMTDVEISKNIEEVIQNANKSRIIKLD